jgi:hypothetical protein
MRSLKHSIPGHGVAALIALALAACAQTPASKSAAQAAVDWQSVATTDNQQAFLDVSSLTEIGGFVEARTKQNFTQPQPSTKKGETYLSALNTYRFDCAQRKVAMKRLEAYAGADLQGPVVQKATSTDKNLRWLDAPESTVFGELLDFACRRR